MLYSLPILSVGLAAKCRGRSPTCFSSFTLSHGAVTICLRTPAINSWLGSVPCFRASRAAWSSFASISDRSGGPSTRQDAISVESIYETSLISPTSDEERQAGLDRLSRQAFEAGLYDRNVMPEGSNDE